MRKNEITELSEIQHVLKKTGMWLGDTSLGFHKRWTLDAINHLTEKDIKHCPALLKMFDEIISNSIDEALRTEFKFANKIDVVITSGSIKVKDNGRGIPVQKAKGSDKIQALMAFTNLRAGANFSDDKQVSIGTHGLGATLVNIMSKTFQAMTCDGTKKMMLYCSDNMSSIKTQYTKGTKKGTEVYYEPDFPRFGVTEFDVDFIKLVEKRVYDLAVCYPDIKFTFNKIAVQNSKFKNYVELLNRPYEILETDDYKLAVVAGQSHSHISFVNGIDTFDGGTHITAIDSQIVKEMLERLNKKYKKFKITGFDIRNHITFVLITNKIPNLKFKSQSKEKVTNNINDVFPYLKVDDNKFYNRIMKNLDIIDPIVETYKLKQEAKERVETKRKAREVTKKVVLKHVQATSKNVAETALYIVEGESAKGNGILVRDSKKHGFYPLKGKPKNVYGLGNKEVLNNVELTDLMNIIGLTLDKPVMNLNYGKIRILADADVDGKSIVGSLLSFFSRWSGLFDMGLIEIVLSPILVVDNGGKMTYYYDLDDYYKDIDNIKGEITYLKGLGSLSKEEYKMIIHEPRILTVSDVSFDDKEQMNVVYHKKNVKMRKEWLMK